MMFGEQHLVRFGSMTKPAGTDPLGDPQDIMDPQQVTYALLSIAQASCLGTNSDTVPFRLEISSLRIRDRVEILTIFCVFPQTVLAGSDKKASGILWPACVEMLHACKSTLRPCMPLTHSLLPVWIISFCITPRSSVFVSCKDPCECNHASCLQALTPVCC